MISSELAKHFDDQMLPLGLTYSAHPVACAAGNANLDVFDELNLVENAASKGKIVDEFACEMMAKHKSIGDWRNRGLLGCFELVKNRDTKETMTPWNAHPSQMEPTSRMLAKVRELGMFTFVRWNWLFIAPPLTINQEELEEGFAIIDEVLKIADEYVV
jgi:taurine--2-oxoglutarate transaminase